jgi:hypothetical protein
MTDFGSSFGDLSSTCRVCTAIINEGSIVRVDEIIRALQ